MSWSRLSVLLFLLVEGGKKKRKLQLQLSVIWWSIPIELGSFSRHERDRQEDVDADHLLIFLFFFLVANRRDEFFCISLSSVDLTARKISHSHWQYHQMSSSLVSWRNERREMRLGRDFLVLRRSIQLRRCFTRSRSTRSLSRQFHPGWRRLLQNLQRFEHDLERCSRLVPQRVECLCHTVLGYGDASRRHRTSAREEIFGTLAER